MKEQFICEILHHLPSFSSDQLAEIKEAIRIVLCKYDLSTKETSLQVVDNSSLHYLQMYLESCEQAGKSYGTIELYQFHLSHFLSYANKDIRNINDDDVYTYLYNYRHKRNVSNSYINQLLKKDSCPLILLMQSIRQNVKKKLRSPYRQKRLNASVLPAKLKEISQ